MFVNEIRSFSEGGESTANSTMVGTVVLFASYLPGFIACDYFMIE